MIKPTKKKNQMSKMVNSTYPTTKINPGNLRKGVRSVNRPTTSRITVQKSSASTVTSWKIRRSTAIKRKLILFSIGYERDGSEI